jgi:hypothetical protein
MAVCVYSRIAGRDVSMTQEDCDELAQMIWQYEKKRGTLQAPVTLGEKVKILFTIEDPIAKLPGCSKIDEKEHRQAKGCDDDDEIDDEDEELEALLK